ncbi:MAG: AgmX/PglI C-terminal domain-containing protein [Kofleriaceae bacterium]
MALRTSLIWHDEVMSDVVSERPVPITIGPQEGATFTTPDLGFTDAFAIVRPRRRGYLLVLGGSMRGTVSIEGVEHDVATLVRTSETPDAYAVPISGLDWGVIELDTTGKLKLFFQFCGVDDVPAAPLFEQALERRASFAFSTLVHAAILFTTYRIYVHHDEQLDQASRDLTAQYNPTRLDPVKPVLARAGAAMTAAPRDATLTVTTPASPMPPAKRFVEPPPAKRIVKPTPTPAPVQPGFVGNQIVDDILKPTTDHGRGIQGLAQANGGGNGPGGPGGPGEVPATTRDGNGPGGPGHGPVGGPGTHVGDLHVGPDRDAVGFCTGATCGGGETEITPNNSTVDHDDDTITATEIQRVMEHSKSLLLSCYQKAVNHNSALAGTVTVRFEISPAGGVSHATVKSTTLGDSGVSDCLTQRLALLHFPPHGGSAVVKYPFVFSAH